MKKIITTLAISGLVTGLVSCGGGTNNDQGTSWTLLGYTDDCSSDPTANLAGVSAALSTDSEPGSFAGGISVGMVSSNNLSVQFIRTENAFFTYYIPGASVQPPATSSTAGSVIKEAGEDGSSLGCVETFIVPAEVRQWLVLNRNFLPELPFTMEVSGSMTGISQAGDRFDTNEVKFAVQFTPDVEIPPAGDGGSDSSATPVPAGDTATGDTTTTDTTTTDTTSGDTQL